MATKWLATAAMALGVGGCAVTAEPADLIVTDVRYYTGTGEGPLTGDIVVRDGAVVAVGLDAAEGYEATDTIDGVGLFAMPGLWDMHAHLRSSENAGLDPQAFLSRGITSVRDPGGYGDRERALTSETSLAIYPSFEMLNGESFAPFQQVVTSEADVDAVVAERAAEGATQIKIHRAFPLGLLPRLVEAARAHGLPVIGHIPLGMHPLAACEAGMAGMEHIGSFLEAYASVTADATGADAALWMLSEEAGPLYRCLADRRVFVTPTLVLYPAVARRRLGDAEWPPEIRDFLANIAAIARRLHTEGVLLLAGTDVSDLEDAPQLVPGTSLHDELVLLQLAGIPARELIVVATGNAARAVGREGETGVIAPGADADFVLLAADPGADIRSTARIVSVFRAGRRVDPAGGE